jgi:gluconate 2-dehydrogenase gamma chain
MSGIRRRDLLAGTALVLVGGNLPKGGEISGQLPWHPGTTAAPQPVKPGPWTFFTDMEAACIGAVANRIIPPDPQTLGGQDAGCVVFIDRQLSGPYGQHAGLYVSGPFKEGSKQQGPQAPQTPSELYRKGIEALDQHSGSVGGGKPFARLEAAAQDDILHGLESSTLRLDGVDGKAFFEQLLKDVQQGFFADPIYGGNHDMCAWKMIGFPGARYDYTDWVSRHNERYPYPPVSIAGRADWNPHR